jgi:molybdopterin-guanine dinucleotide biosynthesis protein A
MTRADEREVAAAILVGGHALRMGGKAKSFLEVGGRRIIDRQLDVLRARFSEILLVANEPEAYLELGLPVVCDLASGQGPLMGILTALCAARADRVLVVGCDMPYVSLAVVDLLCGAPPHVDVVVPVAHGRPEPLLAIYAKSCAPAIRARLSAGAYKTASLLDDLSVYRLEESVLSAVDPELRCLCNVNTPADLAMV